MSPRVYLHVGTPKSGTSYLQDKLALNRPLLDEQGLDYLRTRTGDHFEAALDLIGERWAGEEKRVVGEWEAMAVAARRSRRTSLVSHEILAAARPDAVARALDSFPDHEPHVVLTARDLGRQIPAEWQERIKHRGGRGYVRFLEALHRNYGRTSKPTWFWRVQHLPRILETWGAHVPPERVHLVTVPPSGGPRDALWNRFAGVLGLDPAAAYDESTTTNASLGGTEVTMLRRLNLELAERKVPREVYVEWVRESIVKDVLAARRESARITVPPEGRARVEAVTASWLESIRASGIDVVGDLADLEPVWPADDEEWSNPDDADPDDVADAAIASLAHVLAAVQPAPEEETPTPAGRLARRWRR